ncbi:MAG: hypothetical protein J0H22_14805, partial [Actinobacteria bacterium]|nr:hypothetical protein [Actinomycetota bacterium]
LASDAEIGRWDARDLAVDAARFLHERAIASVVVVITDEADRPVPNSESELQRTVVVAEVGDRVWLPMNTLSPPTWPSRRSWRSSQSDLDADPSTSVYDLGWCDLLYLLRVELPWWPVGSRCVDVIAGWPRAH